MRNLTAQELAAIEIIRRGEAAVTGIQGTFNGEDAIFVVQVSPVEGSDELRIYPLAMLLRDEDMPFVGGPHEEHPVGPERVAWPDQSVAAKPAAWPDDGVISQPAGWPEESPPSPDETPESGSAVPAAAAAAIASTGAPAPAVAPPGRRGWFGRRKQPAPAPTVGATLDDTLAPYVLVAAEAEAAEAARVAAEAEAAEAARAAHEREPVPAMAAVTEPPLTRADILRQRRETAARGGQAATKRRRGWPTLDLSVRTSRILLAAGRTLIAFGTLLLLFVAYELWGTGIHEARAQKQLKRDFQQSLATPTTTPPVTTPGATTTQAPAAPEGEAVALIEIPKIGLNKAVVDGVGVPDLKKAPGHYPDTPLPGQPGNAAIAGHRTTYGAPFNRLDELKAGDPIIVTTRGEVPVRGRHLDRRQADRGVGAQPHLRQPAHAHDVQPEVQRPATAHRGVSPRRRAATATAGRARPATDGPPPDGPPRRRSLGRERARRPTLLWGAIVAGVAFLIWFVGRIWRRWPVYLLGAPVFLLVLFIFFENVSRLLPANV